jgi:thiopeptide-type bacteriocin biosynthesis protein
MAADNKTIDHGRTRNQPMKPQKPLKREFIVGDEWLYYKFYTGPKTADFILTEIIKPETEALLSRKIIDHWFFIRYADPQLHTRVRFHIAAPQSLGVVIQRIRSLLIPIVEQNLVWKVQLDTYQREVERYGSNSMELAEQWFFHDSQMVVNMLALIEGDEGEQIRWQFALRAVDSLLEDFRFDMEQKFELITVLRENYGREHGMNRNLKDQLEKKFRAHRSVIDELMARSSDAVSEMLPLFKLLEQKSAAVQPLAEEILSLHRKRKLQVHLNDLMGSYSHMMVNRLFKSKQRTHEMVLYDFLHRYYKSEIARRKYSKINLQKKKKSAQGAGTSGAGFRNT